MPLELFDCKQIVLKTEKTNELKINSHSYLPNILKY